MRGTVCVSVALPRASWMMENRKARLVAYAYSSALRMSVSRSVIALMLRLRYEGYHANPVSVAVWRRMTLPSLSGVSPTRMASSDTRARLPSSASPVMSVTAYSILAPSIDMTAVMVAVPVSTSMMSLLYSGSGSPEMRWTRMAMASMTVVLPDPFCPYIPVMLPPDGSRLNDSSPCPTFRT